MTSPEMKEELLLTLDRWAALDTPSYNDFEISSVLTRAQENVIKRRYNPYGNKYREGFDSTEKRRKEIRKIVKGPYGPSGDPLASRSSDQTAALGTSSSSIKGTLFDLPDDLWLSIYEKAIITSSDDCADLTEDGVSLKEASVDPITHDEIDINSSNPFRKPNDRRVWRLDQSAELDDGPKNVHELITSVDNDVDRYLIRYIRYPKPIITDDLQDPVRGSVVQTDPELDETVHAEIVQEAARLAAAETNPKEYQFRAAEAQRTE